MKNFFKKAAATSVAAMAIGCAGASQSATQQTTTPVASAGTTSMEFSECVREVTAATQGANYFVTKNMEGGNYEERYQPTYNSAQEMAVAFCTPGGMK